MMRLKPKTHSIAACTKIKMKLNKILESVKRGGVIKPSSLSKAAGLTLKQLEEAASTEEAKGIRTSLLLVSSQQPESTLSRIIANIHYTRGQLEAKNYTPIQNIFTKNHQRTLQKLDFEPSWTNKHLFEIQKSFVELLTACSQNVSISDEYQQLNRTKAHSKALSASVSRIS